MSQSNNVAYKVEKMGFKVYITYNPLDRSQLMKKEKELAMWNKTGYYVSAVESHPDNSDYLVMVLGKNARITHAIRTGARNTTKKENWRV